MRDGVYKVHFNARGIKGFNIVALSGGTFCGCDQSHYVTGTYKQSGNRFTGDLVMTRHDRPPGFVEIANLDAMTVRCTGICGESFGQFEAKILERPDLPIAARFELVCDL